MPDIEATLIGRTVMVGDRQAEIFDYNKFNRPPFAWYFSDGEKAFGWRENFYVLPTREEIQRALERVHFSDSESDRIIQLFDSEAWPLADAVLQLLKGAE